MAPGDVGIGSVSRVTAADRFRRIVAIVPWIAERNGPTVDEVCERFDITRDELLSDLDVVFMVGIPPYTPDELIDVIIEDDRVFLNLGDYFRHPLRLTTPEALTLVAAGRGLLATPGADESGPLARALSKLANTLGIDRSEAVAVDLGTAEHGVIPQLRAAVAHRETVEIDYYGYAKDDHTTRQVDGYRVHASDGNWYLFGWCHLAEDERVFRIDRIAEVRGTGRTFAAPTVAPPTEVYRGRSTDHRIVLDVDASAGWIAEHYPVESVAPAAPGRIRVRMAVGGDAWLERLLLRLGPDAQVVEATDPDGDPIDVAPYRTLAAQAARRVLRRYGE